MSGAFDPTAHDALTDVYRDETERDRKVMHFIKCIKALGDITGFEIINRIEILDRESGKIYR